MERQVMKVDLVTVLLLIPAGILLLLLIRFVQPELIYGLRQVLVQVEANKTFLGYEAGRDGLTGSFQRLLIADARYEALDLDEEYVFNRIQKIRELYRALDPRRPLADKSLRDSQRPQVCIIELASLLSNLGRQVSLQSEFQRPIISERGILAFIANEIRLSQMEPPLSDADVQGWFVENPISVEQVIELLIAAAFGLALRQRSSSSEHAAEGHQERNPLLEILTVEKQLRFLVRAEYQKRYTTEQDRNARIAAVLGEIPYSECVRRMESSRSRSKDMALDFFDFLYIAHLETLIFGEWEWFRSSFEEKKWIKERMVKLIQVRNELAHGREVAESLQLLVLGYCFEIRDRIKK
jgi:hypothetical protein